MPQVEVDGLTINYDVQGEGEPLLLIPYRRPTTPATRSSCRPTPSTSAASRSTFPARARATSRPGRTRPRATPTRSPPSSAPSGSSGRTSRASRSAPPWACTWPPAIRAACARSRCTAPGTASDRLSEDRRRAVAHARAVAADRRRRGDPGHLPVVLHARDVRRPAGVRRHAGGLRAQPPRPAAGRVPGPDRGGHRARRERACWARSTFRP